MNLFLVFAKFLLSILLITANDDYWFKVDKRLRLSFTDSKVRALFNSKQIVPLSAVLPPEDGLCEKSPVLENVRMFWRFTSNMALLLHLRDTFCAGQRYTVRDNGQFLALQEQDLPTICGVSTSSLDIIYSPAMMEVTYPLDPGQHNLSISILGSRIGNKVTSMQISLNPIGDPVDGITAYLEFQEMCRSRHEVPPDIIVPPIDTCPCVNVCRKG